jgi:hypothetical protein
MTSPFNAATTRNTIPVATAGSSQPTVITNNGRAGTVTAVSFIPLATITGANTNTRSYSLVNKGSSGAGNTVIATLQFDSGVNATGNVVKVIPLSGTAANLAVAVGDVLIWNSNAVGTGQADPGGLVSVANAATYA